jgi:transcriptional regulator with XRE-family HTH domain
VSVGKRLLEIRKPTGSTQAAFAEAFGISDRAYKNYELDIREIPLGLAIAICERHDVSLSWLATGIGGKNPQHLQSLIETSILIVKRFLRLRNHAVSDETEARLVSLLFVYLNEHGASSQKMQDLLLEAALKGVSE